MFEPKATLDRRTTLGLLAMLLGSPAAAQSALEKRDAQRALLEHAQAHAEMQRKTAATTLQMADARRELLALETKRLEEQAAELSATEDAINDRKAEARQRAASENITRDVLERLKKLPSAQQAAARLAEVINNQRRAGND